MRRIGMAVLALLLGVPALSGYVNFETSHVNPIALTPSGLRLLVVNTPDALLEVFSVQPDGALTHEAAIPVGLEPVTVVARSDGEAWVVNNLSDSISIVDLDLGVVINTFDVGDEPTDVAFASNGAVFVAVSSEDRVKIFAGSGPSLVGTIGPLPSRDVRALAASTDGTKIYAVMLRSGNQTTVVNSNVVHDKLVKAGGVQANSELHEGFYTEYDLGRLGCLDGDPPSPPRLPDEIQRNPNLTDPADGNPINSIIVRWDEPSQAWLDVSGSDWSHCVRMRLPDKDLFAIDAATWAVTPVAHLGTSLFDVSVNPADGKVYVPNTDARNFVRFEHDLGLRGHFVDNRLAVVDPAQGYGVTIVELNAHIDRKSDPQTNLAERQASISQPGMMAWKSDGSVAYLTAIGSNKVFRVSASCLSPSCIFGADRANPDAVEVGLGATGAVLRESAQPEYERLYVLNRIDHALSIVKTETMEVLEEIALHDPSSDTTRLGRRFLYESIEASGHGDASCASCHLFGDMDGLAWELGNPEDELVPYTTLYDNVKFTKKDGDSPPGSSEIECQEAFPACTAREGFDPQKGPMVTQTLRGMLEPLHSRGDRATFRDFNPTFVTLMGAANIAPPGHTLARLPDSAMEQFRQFALGIQFPPNPFRNVDDTTPCQTRNFEPDCEISIHGNLLPGNPTEGDKLFHVENRYFNYPFVNTPCTFCHQTAFGTFGGVAGGVEPTEPVSSDVTWVRAGDWKTEFPVRHSDVEIAHLRNMYERFGPNPSSTHTPTDSVAGFGYTHDGSIPDMLRFATSRTFIVSDENGWQDLRDIVAFLFTFPTGTKPSVGRQVTVSAGTPPTGSAEDEALLATLTTLGDVTDGQRHCELVAHSPSDSRVRSYVYAAGAWLTDVAGEAAISMQALRETAGGPLTFTCATLDSGLRLGGDRDEDGVLDGDDCAPADADLSDVPPSIAALHVEQSELIWENQGPLVSYDLLSGDLAGLRTTGITVAGCLAGGLTSTTYQDLRPAPPVGDAYFYLVRGVNPCGVGSLGPGREPLATLTCP